MKLTDEEICQMCCGDILCNDNTKESCFEFSASKRLLNKYIQKLIDKSATDIDKDVHKQIEDLLDKRKVNSDIFECGMFNMGKCPSNRCSNCLADMIVDIVKKSGCVKLQADEDGLDDICLICNEIYTMDKSPCEICTVERFELINKFLKAQKAIDNQRIEELSTENRELNDRIKELEELMLTRREAVALMLALQSYMSDAYGTAKLPEWASKLQSVIGDTE